MDGFFLVVETHPTVVTGDSVLDPVGPIAFCFIMINIKYIIYANIILFIILLL